MLNTLKISRRLLVLNLSFLPPVIVLSSLLFYHSQQTIRVTQSELNGEHYVYALEQEMFAAVALADGTGSAADLKAAAEVVDRLNAQFGETFNAQATAAKSAAAIGRLADGGSASAADHIDAALDAIVDQISRVEDGSSLTLDPSLDTYYVQDLMSVKLPSMVAAANSRRAHGRSLAGANQHP